MSTTTQPTPAETATAPPPEPGAYTWAVEHAGWCIGSTGLRVDDGQHRASYTVGLFVAGLRLPPGGRPPRG